MPAVKHDPYYMDETCLDGAIMIPHGIKVSFCINVFMSTKLFPHRQSGFQAPAIRVRASHGHLFFAATHLPQSAASMSFNFSVPPASTQPRGLSSFEFTSGQPHGSQQGSPSAGSLLLSPAGSPPSSSRQPQIDPNLFADELSALFVDTLANQFSFGDAEQDLRKNLHGFARVNQ